jgi:diguanylate cyclase (GGDEF)-like protein
VGSVGRNAWIAASLLLAIAVGLLDYVTGSELSFSLFYLFPIALLTWFAGRRAGIALSLLCAGLWLVAEALGERLYSPETVLYWNTFIRLGFFVVVTLLLSALRVNLRYQERLAHIDPATGAANRRAFMDELQRELARAARYGRPYTVAYLDLDNFKLLNDSLGHGVGDKALNEVANVMKTHLRRTDVFARLGGDEFALLLPEADEAAARQVVTKLHGELQRSMDRHLWPISFSIGVLVVHGEVGGVDHVVRLADGLMYSVKQGGKSGIRYEVIPEEPRSAA